MANGPGGRRKGAGRKTTVTGWRQWCRDTVLSPEVQQVMLDRALKDADFALRLAEAGFGRPPQAMDLKVSGDEASPLVYKATFADGSPVSAPVEAVPEGTDS